MMINPMQIIQLMQGNGNPLPMLNNMFGQPLVNRALTMLQGKTPQEQEQIVRNLANARGVDLNDFIRQLQQFNTP